MVQRVETRQCQLPKRREQQAHGHGATTGLRTIIRTETDDGVVGWGEAAMKPTWGGLGQRYYGESHQTVEHVVHDLLGPIMVGQDEMDPADFSRRAGRVVVGHPHAKAAIDMSLQDIRGKVAGLPLGELLAGGQQRASVEIAHSIGIGSDESVVSEAREAIEAEGVRAIQIKGGIDPSRDVRITGLLRSKFPDVFIQVDANRAYGSDPGHVVRICQALEDAGASALEQPADSIDAMRKGADAVLIPVVADEACWQPGDVVELASNEAADAVSVYVSKAGGIYLAVLVAELAVMSGLKYNLGGSFESAIGTAASLQVALSATGTPLPSVMTVPATKARSVKTVGSYWLDDLAESGPTFVDGHLAPTMSPGLGVEIDDARIERFTVPGTIRTTVRQ